MADRLPINASGRVPCWQIEAGRMVELHPVDAREQLRMGLVSLTQPPEETAAQPKVSPAPAAEVTSELSLPASAHLEEMTVKQLERYVEENGIEVDLDKHRLKEDKVKAIKAAIHGAEPSAVEV